MPYYMGGAGPEDQQPTIWQRLVAWIKARFRK